MEAVAALLTDANPYIRGRALFLLYQLGADGVARAGAPESQPDPELKIAAYRAMRRSNHDVLPTAAGWRATTMPAFAAKSRCRCATCRPSDSIPILIELARTYDGQDRSYLEAWGTGATGKEALLYDPLRTAMARTPIRSNWSAAFARLAWRLHVPTAVPDLLARARSATLPWPIASARMDTIAFVDDKRASRAMLALAAPAARSRSRPPGGC